MFFFHASWHGPLHGVVPPTCGQAVHSYPIIASIAKAPNQPLLRVAPVELNGPGQQWYSHSRRVETLCQAGAQQQPNSSSTSSHQPVRSRRRPRRSRNKTCSSDTGSSRPIEFIEADLACQQDTDRCLAQQQLQSHLSGGSLRPPSVVVGTELQLANIEYTVSSSVSSYTDPDSCSVSYPEDQGTNGNGKQGEGTASSKHSIRPSELHQSDAETVRGLIYGATVRFSDSAALRLRRRAMVVWEQRGPQRVLIVKKPVPAAAAVLREMAVWLEKQGLQVFVESAVHEEFPQYCSFDPNITDVDFAITLGGDGTVLHLASLFAEDTPLPPVMCFAMGTLGFLTPFDAASYRSCLARVLAANRQPLYCTLRTRKRCVVFDSAGERLRVHHILNECVIDRGACPSSVHLEIYIDGSFVTAAEADGLIVATPSGSTAYSMSAGGSMVAPSVPCTLITPLSPHSLSFRPLIIPENADLLIRLPQHARSHARASFDGKHPMRIQRGDSVHFATSLCPLPLINIGSLDTDWYEGITQKLKWNQSIRSVPEARESLVVKPQHQHVVQQQLNQVGTA